MVVLWSVLDGAVLQHFDDGIQIVIRPAREIYEQPAGLRHTDAGELKVVIAVDLSQRIAAMLSEVREILI